MKKSVIIFLLAVMVIQLGAGFGSSAKKKKEILFPRREYVKKQSQVFFKKVNLTLPLIAKVEFFTRTETYLSGYMHLTPYIEKTEYFREILPLFGKGNRDLIEKFDSYKKELGIENYRDYQKRLGIGDLEFYLLAINVLYNDYRNNRLSGDQAFKMWNFVLGLTQGAYKNKKKTAENAAILTVSSHFIFFKEYKKWEKKVKKILKKVNLDAVTDADVLLILKK